MATFETEAAAKQEGFTGAREPTHKSVIPGVSRIAFEVRCKSVPESDEQTDPRLRREIELPVRVLRVAASPNR